MADKDHSEPGWPFNEQLPPVPPAQPPAPAPPAAMPPPPSPAAPPPAPLPAQTYEPQSYQPQSYEPPAPGYTAPPPAPPQAYAPPPAAYGGPGQPPPPPPGQYQYYNQPKKSRKSIWITLATIFGVLVLAIGACTVWFVGTVKAPVDESNRFLAQVDAGNYPAALAMMTTPCNGGNVAVTDFDNIFGDAPIEYDLKNSSIVNSDATVSGTFSSPTRAEDGITVFLRNRDGWKVCGFQLG